MSYTCNNDVVIKSPISLKDKLQSVEHAILTSRQKLITQYN